MCFHFSWILLGHMVTLVFYILRNCRTVFQSSYSILHSHQQCRRVPVSPWPCQYLYYFFLIIAMLVDVGWYLTVIETSFNWFCCIITHLWEAYLIQRSFDLVGWLLCEDLGAPEKSSVNINGCLSVLRVLLPKFCYFLTVIWVSYLTLHLFLQL